MRSQLTAAAALAASLALAGCWGGDDDNDVVTPPVTPPVTAVPDSAIASTTAFVSYLGGLSLTDETSEPLTLPSGDAPVSETEEPKTV